MCHWKGVVAVLSSPVGGGFCWYWLSCLVPVFCMVVRGVKQSPAIVVCHGCKLQAVLQGAMIMICSIV